MDLRVIEKADMAFLIENLINRFRVEGVVKKNNAFAYDTIRSPGQVCLDFDRTILPPKKYFLPQKETLLRFRTNASPSVEEVVETHDLVLFGVHPYDLKAIRQMDRIFQSGVPDPHYLRRRQGITLIGVDPLRLAPRSFWADTEPEAETEGFDLMLTDIGGPYVVQTGSPKGRDLLERYAKTRSARKEEIGRRTDLRRELLKRSRQHGLNFPKAEVPQLLESAGEKMLWEDRAAKCLSCGSCNLVCPTCYCFDVRDDVSLDLTRGSRFRRWDGCLLEDFAKVATGENFRESRAARFRHRLYRKGLYLYPLLHDLACVGCGRCSCACLPDIADPLQILNQLKEDQTARRN